MTWIRQPVKFRQGRTVWDGGATNWDGGFTQWLDGLLNWRKQ